ncbi:MAG: replication factor C large subunit [Terrestrivirus sp.]|uniref:Replication factor C large subunit n=1 Tax=Terrestrivirus sp. TaxID=2487775 RepID=A0A3G4ZQF4_9VIRU|nr:MAG: replication factor C large subunit [Terrestrivirus sp.]
MEYIDDTNRDGTSWTAKYCPKNLDQIIGNTETINFIGTWLMKFEENKIKALADMKNKKRKRKIKIAIDIVDDEVTDNTDNTDNNDNVDNIDNIDNIDNRDNIGDNDDVVDTLDNIDREDDEAIISEKISDISKKGPMSCVTVIGNHGVGKTCIINAILKTMGYVKQTINFSKIKKGTDIKDAISGIMNSSNIVSIMDGTRNNKICVVIDEVEAISSGSGRTCIIALLKNNIMTWTCPVIFISDGQHSRLLTELKKNSHEIKIPTPFKNEMLQLMKKILTNEKMLIHGANYGPFNSSLAYELIDHSQKDYRRLIMTLYDLKCNFSNKVITQSMFEEYLKLSKKKDEDFDLFRATNKLLQGYKSIDECIRYYETDKVVLPLMVQQNYIECINSKIGDMNSSDKFDIACCISELLSEGDVVENYIYGDQNWDINEVHGYYTCVAPSFLLTEKLKKEKYLQLAYPTDLNKASISKINKKNITNASKAFKNKNINDYIYINLIIRFLTSEDRIKECVDYLKDRDINIGNIESLMKVDKIKSKKTNLTLKQRKEISSFLNK